MQASSSTPPTHLKIYCTGLRKIKDDHKIQEYKKLTTKRKPDFPLIGALNLSRGSDAKKQVNFRVADGIRTTP